MKLRIYLSLLLFLATGGSAFPEDWPQWMGPTRDNRWKFDNAVEKFPAGGPPVVWRSEVAGGYAGPAVVGNRVYVTDFIAKSNVKIDNFNRATFEGVERVLCLDEATGKEVWKHQYDVVYTMSYPAGPRCTPIVDEGKLYTLGAEGNLLCFEAESGKVLWKRDLPTEYKTKTALWGYASHPLIDGPRLICVVGGEGTHTVAFDKKTGKEVWRFGSANEQGYSPPTIIRAAGVRQLILANPQAVNSVDPESGKLLWSQPYEATNGSIIMTPIAIGEHLFVGGYSNHNLLLRLAQDKPGATTISRDVAKKFVSPVNVQPFVDGELILGMDQNGEMTAFQLPDGKRLWESSEVLGPRPEGSGSAFIVKNQDRFFLFNEKGELVIAKMSKEGYKTIDRAKVLEPTNFAFGREVVWCAPAFANGKMYVRNDKECIAVDLKRK